MSIEKLTKLKTDTQKLIDTFDKKHIYGPIAYLEECLDSLDAAIEEMELEEADWVGGEEE